MKFETSYPKELYNLLVAMKPIVELYDQLFLVDNQKRFTISQVEGTLTMMAIVDIYPSFFEYYQAEPNEIVASRYNPLLKALKNYKDLTKLSIETDESKIKLYGETKSVKKNLELALLEHVDEDLMIKPPDVNYKFVARLNVSNLISYLSEISLIDTNFVSFNKRSDVLEIYAEAYDGKVKNEITIADNIANLTEEDISANFVVENVLALLNAGKAVSNEVQLAISTNFPLQLKFESEHAILTYYLAPVIEQE